jgi:hypothetical protein
MNGKKSEKFIHNLCQKTCTEETAGKNTEWLAVQYRERNVCEGVDWIYLAQNWVPLRVFMKKLVELLSESLIS